MKLSELIWNKYKELYPTKYFEWYSSDTVDYFDCHTTFPCVACVTTSNTHFILGVHSDAMGTDNYDYILNINEIRREYAIKNILK